MKAFLRNLWLLLTGQLLARLAQLEADQRWIVAHYNDHMAFTRSKLQAVSNHSNQTRATVMALASRIEVEQRQRVEVVEHFGAADDESTIQLDDVDIVMVPRRNL